METSLDQMWYLPGMFNYQKVVCGYFDVFFSMAISHP